MTETTLVTLGEGALACADCGKAVAEPDPAMIVYGKRVRRGRVTPVLMATCDACAERDRVAADLAQRHLRLGVTVGDRRYGGKDAARLLIEARTAYDAAGVQPLPVESAKDAAAALTAEVEHLSRAVGGLRFRDRINPPESLVAPPMRLVQPGTANPRPWSHLEQGERARLIEATGRVLAERVALLSPPVALPPPVMTDREASLRGSRVTGGCLWCGVGVIALSALAVTRLGGPDAAARSVWTLRQVNPVSIGATKGGPDRLLGWLCPACEKAAASSGSASSATAMEDALSTYLGVSRRSMAGDELWVLGVKGWGALVDDAVRRGKSGPSPNSEPWGHLPRVQREALANDWRRGGA